MKKYLLIKKSNNQLKSYSKGLNEVDPKIFEQCEVDLTNEEFDNLQNNKYDKFKNDKLILRDDIQKAIDVKAKINNAKSIAELREFILTELIK